MTLVSNLRQKLAELEPSSDRHDLQVADATSGSAVNIAILQRDAMSCKLLELIVRRPAPSDLDIRQWAEQIAGCVTSLLEPLQVFEVDTQRQQALLRSAAPVRQQDNLLYYETVLEGTTLATVRRFQSAMPQNAPTRRTQVAFALTHEGLFKLVSDLISVCRN